MKRILLTIEYDGTRYSGWQKQPNQKTVQGEIEAAFYRCIGEKIELFASGRTDAGVHAKHQTAHFDMKSPVPVEKIAYILNNALPSDISVDKAEEVDSDFHARFSIKKKVYQYKIYSSNKKNVFISNCAAWIKDKLDIDKMKKVGRLIEGEHDFHGFCSSNTCVQDFVRKIFYVNVYEKDDFVYVEVCGNGFLYNMVRIIVGTMVDYSLGKLSLDDIERALKEGKREYAGQTMPACGLYLIDTIY